MSVKLSIADRRALRRAAKLLSDVASSAEWLHTFPPEHVEYPPEDAHIGSYVADCRRVVERLRAISERAA